MKIELRNLKTYERMSEETNCFDAMLYIDGKCVGYAKNQGTGGPTDYNINYSEDSETMSKNREILNQAEAYCEQLPPIDLGEKYGTIPNSMESVIDHIVEEHLNEKQSKKLEKKMQKYILWGNKFTYAEYTWGKDWPLSRILQLPNAKEHIQKAIEDLKKNHPKWQLLNTNIPAELLQ